MSTKTPKTPETDEQRMARQGLGYYYLVFVGVQTDSKGKALYCYFQISEDEAASGQVDPAKLARADSWKGLCAWDKVVGSARPGQIIKCQATAGQEEIATVHVGSGRYQRTITNEEYAAAWQIRERSREQDLAAKKKLAKEQGRNLVYERLEPLKAEYQAAGATRRQQILAELIRYVTG